MKLEIRGQHIAIVERERLVSGTVSYTAEFAFDAAWDGYTPIAVFEGVSTRQGKISKERAIKGGKCDVPPETLLPEGYLSVGVYGLRDGERLPTIYTDRQFVARGTESAEPAAEYTPGIVEQFVAQTAEDREAAETAADRAEEAATRQPYPNAETGTWWVWDALVGEYRDTGEPYGGSGGGAAGKDGGYYTPSVTQPDGSTMRVEYTASAPAMPAVAPVDVTLPAGPQGAPGKDGTDGKDGADGRPGADGYSPTASVTQTETGAVITITDKTGTTTAALKNGDNGAPGKDGITPNIGDNGNWYLGDVDTGKPSRGDQGEPGDNGKSAYQYAQEGGYTKTEEEFAAKLAEEMPEKLPNPKALTFTGAVTGSYDGSEELTLEIPSGGGGSVSGESTFMLETETTEEVSAVEWGLPVNWDKIIQLNINAVVPSQDSDLALYAYCGGTVYKAIGTLAAGAANGVNIYMLRTLNLFVVGISIAKSYPENARPVMPTSGLSLASGQNILRLYSNTSGVGFPVGTKFAVWGVYIQ